jgi:hypothetical protein
VCISVGIVVVGDVVGVPVGDVVGVPVVGAPVGDVVGVLNHSKSTGADVGRTITTGIGDNVGSCMGAGVVGLCVGEGVVGDGVGARVGAGVVGAPVVGVPVGDVVGLSNHSKSSTMITGGRAITTGVGDNVGSCVGD